MRPTLLCRRRSLLNSMFSTICRRIPTWVPPKEEIGVGPKLVILVKSFSSSGVCRNASEKSFAFSYLIDSCGLSSEDALIASKKVRVKSSKKSDAVLELFRKYGFTNADIIRLVNQYPHFIVSKPEETLLPKLEFFCSIGVPLSILGQKLSFNPTILHRSLRNFIIPWYNTLKGVVQSDERVVRVFLQATSAFESIPSKIDFLREQGVPESSIVSLVSHSPSVMISSRERLAASVHRAAEMGIDKNKLVFAHAIEVYAGCAEATLKHKMDVYRRCGWSEPDINTAFSKFPLCMKLSEKKIMANLDFLVRKMGFDLVAVAHCPSLLSYSLDKRMKPRFLIARFLNAKGLKKMGKSINLLTQCEEVFMKRYIVPYQRNVPELLDLYQGKLSLDEMGISQDVLDKITFDVKHGDADRS